MSLSSSSKHPISILHFYPRHFVNCQNGVGNPARAWNEVEAAEEGTYFSLHSYSASFIRMKNKHNITRDNFSHKIHLYYYCHFDGIVSSNHTRSEPEYEKWMKMWAEERICIYTCRCYFGFVFRLWAYRKMTMNDKVSLSRASEIGFW